MCRILVGNGAPTRVGQLNTRNTKRRGKSEHLTNAERVKKDTEWMFGLLGKEGGTDRFIRELRNMERLREKGRLSDVRLEMLEKVLVLMVRKLGDGKLGPDLRGVFKEILGKRMETAKARRKDKGWYSRYLASLVINAEWLKTT